MPPFHPSNLPKPGIEPLKAQEYTQSTYLQRRTGLIRCPPPVPPAKGIGNRNRARQKIHFPVVARFALRSLFINYRRNDSAGETGRLFDDLTARFSDKSVFMDVAGIEPGRDFRKAIDLSVANCSILLAMIGQEWLDCRDSLGGRRLDDPNDFVRIELACALRRDIPVVPVLVRGAKMPFVEQLPDDLKDLAFRNAMELTHARWKSDVEVLVRAVRPYIDLPENDAPAIDLAAATRPEVSTTLPVGAPHEQASPPFNIDPQDIERIGRELAVYIGPIADLVVKRAARRSASLEDLYREVVHEIDDETDQANFLRSGRN